VDLPGRSPVQCEALDASIDANFIPLVWKISRQSALDMNTAPSGVANRGLTFVFDIRHPNWYIATKIQALSVSISIEFRFRGLKPLLNQN
jgi:hypothetical protein